MEYAVWRNDMADEDLAWISSDLPPELDDIDPDLSYGESVKNEFPDGIAIDLSEDHGIKLGDAIPNIHSMLFVGEKLKDILENSGAPFDFHPIRIRNQRQRIVKKKYYIANLLQHISCLDKKKSEFRMSAILPDQVVRFRQCVLDESKIPEGTKIFRLSEMKETIFLTVPFAREIIYTHKCTGMFLQRIEHYGKEFRRHEGNNEK